MEFLDYKRWKITLFNALTSTRAESKNYPFCTIEPNVGKVEIKMRDLIRYLKYQIQRKIYNQLEFVDIVGSKGRK